MTGRSRNGETVHAAAPLRLDFAGGWTDVPPFSAREGGTVINATIGLWAHAVVEPGGEGITLKSEDLGEELRVSGLDELHSNGRLALLQTALRLFPLSPSTLSSRSDAPAGSGLGSSGALDVALVSVLSHALGKKLGPEELARMAWRLEVEEAGIPGGKQDQWASALGGFRRFTFHDPRVESEPLRLDSEFLNYLERHLVLCYTGTSRMSGTMIGRVVAGYEKGEEKIVGAFHGMKDVAERMADALRAGNPEQVGRLLEENWAHQRALDPGMQTGDMAKLEQAVSAAGVFGGKAAGAGAGGCMFFLAKSDRDDVARAARSVGAQILPVTWMAEGVRTW